jgi:hypothetical protein
LARLDCLVDPGCKNQTTLLGAPKADFDSSNNQEDLAMSNVSKPGKRLGAAIKLRDAALALLQEKGKPHERREGDVVFEPHTPQNPEPRLSLLLSEHPLDRRDMLSVWATLKGKHAKVMNIEWLGEVVQLVSFRRGEWESELLAMGRVGDVAAH